MENAIEKKGLERLKCLDSLTLKIIAMALMLLDHAWGTVMPGGTQFAWMTAVGRIAFPIFAFQLAEGFMRTHNRKKYLKRMFIFALISEIPFNFMVGGGPIYPVHQNVMFTFCIALLAMTVIENSKSKKPALRILISAAAVLVSVLAGFLTMVDYFGYGVAMVLIFYFFHGKRFGWIAELVGLWYINWEAVGGLVYMIPIGSTVFELPEQGLAVLALIPIWLYNGRQGRHSKAIQYACYAFYPAHITVLVIISAVMSALR